MNYLLINAILLVTLLSGCGQMSSEPVTNESVQTMWLTVDDKKFDITQEDILVTSYVGQTHLGFSAMSEKQDIQFLLVAYLTELKPGIYRVHNCFLPSECDQAMDDKNQSAHTGPYPKDPMPPTSLFRAAYNAPSLGLEPLTLTITSVTDEQQPGWPHKTKRLKGQFQGVLAYVEQKPKTQDWYIVGNTTKVEGRFDVFCSIQ